MNIFETHLFSSHPLSAPNHLSDKRTHKVAVRPVPVQTLKKLKRRPKVPQVLRIFFRDFSSEAQPLFKPRFLWSYKHGKEKVKTRESKESLILIENRCILEALPLKLVLI